VDDSEREGLRSSVGVEPRLRWAASNLDEDDCGGTIMNYDQSSLPPCLGDEKRFDGGMYRQMIIASTRTGAESGSGPAI